VKNLENSLINLPIVTPQNTIWIAYSGGLDSQVLLHLCAHSIYRPQLKTIHVHHGLSKNAEQWVEHCQTTCQNWQIPLFVKYITIAQSKKESLEEIARKERYQVFEKLLKEKDVLLMAHHANDQAETFLLRALRGAGVEGLSAIPQQRSLGKGILCRPFLDISRIALEQYANENKLTWIEDESNCDERFDRNFLRHQIMPHLKSRWKNLEQTFGRTAQLQTENAQLLLEIAQEDFNKCRGISDDTLNISNLLQLSQYRQTNVLRCWLKKLGFETPSQIKIKQIQQDILLSKPDRQPCVTWRNAEIRRYRKQLYAMSPLPFLQPFEFIWNTHENVKLPVGELSSVSQKIGLKSGCYIVKYRQGGEKCLLYGQHHEIKKLLQEKGIPTWLRAFIPLIYDEKIVVAIPNVMIADSYRVERGVEPIWKF